MNEFQRVLLENDIEEDKYIHSTQLLTYAEHVLSHEYAPTKMSYIFTRLHILLTKYKRPSNEIPHIIRLSSIISIQNLINTQRKHFG